MYIKFEIVTSSVIINLDVNRHKIDYYFTENIKVLTANPLNINFDNSQYGCYQK